MNGGSSDGTPAIERKEKSDLQELARIAYQAASKILHTREEAEDITQDTFVVLFMQQRYPDNDQAWVATVANNLALRRKRRLDMLAAKLLVADVWFVAPVDATDDQVLARLVVDKMLAALAPQQREALRRRYGEDLSQATVAEVMRIGGETVKEHVARGKGNARTVYEQMMGKGGD